MAILDDVLIDRLLVLKAFRRAKADAMYSLDMILEVVDIVENYLLSLAHWMTTAHRLVSWFFA
jgi:hypothetical protein